MGILSNFPANHDNRADNFMNSTSETQELNTHIDGVVVARWWLRLEETQERNTHV